MKTIKTTIVLILISFSVSAQYYDYAFSAEIDHQFNKNIEIRGEYENWYIGLYGENLRLEGEESFGYGFNLGMYNRYNDLFFFYGVKLGILDKGNNKPLYGINTEINYMTSDVFFIGLKAEYSMYNNGLYNENINTVSVPKIAIKFGIKF